MKKGGRSGDAADILVGTSTAKGFIEGDAIVGGTRLLGGPGDDVLSGGPYPNAVFGGRGDDVLRGRGGPDWIFGNAGSDHLDGGRGRDELNAGRGEDRMYARDGTRDKVVGGTGRDWACVDRLDRLRGVERVCPASAPRLTGSRA
jgi:Ca2+-binding RTX toxin-like protein